MADPTVVNSTSGTAAVASPTATFGFTATAGNLLVFAVCADDYDTGVPSGWSQPTGCGQENYAGVYLWYKIASGSESSLNYGIGSATTSSWCVAEFDSIDATPIDVSNGQKATSSVASYSTPAITPTTGRRLAVAAIAGTTAVSDFTGIGTWTNSYTEVEESFNNAAATNGIIGLAYLVLDGDGSSTTSTNATYANGISGITESQYGLIAAFVVDSGPATLPGSGAPELSILTASGAGTFWSFQYDEWLKPTGTALTNLAGPSSPNDHLDIDDDPDTPDSNWLLVQ